jgi:hypothetical protein
VARRCFGKKVSVGRGQLCQGDPLEAWRRIGAGSGLRRVDFLHGRRDQRDGAGKVGTEAAIGLNSRRAGALRRPGQFGQQNAGALIAGEQWRTIIMLESDFLLGFHKRCRRQENSGHEDRNGGLEHRAVPSQLEAPPSWPGRKLLPQHDVTPTRRLPGHCPPSGNVAFPVRPRLLLHSKNYIAATASQSANHGHLLSFRLSRELPAPWAALPQIRSKRASSVAQGLSSRPQSCPNIECFRE